MNSRFALGLLRHQRRRHVAVALDRLNEERVGELTKCLCQQFDAGERNVEKMIGAAIEKYPFSTEEQVMAAAKVFGHLLETGQK